MKAKKRRISFILATVFALSITISNVSNAADCYEDWYVQTSCSRCDDSTYNTTQTDTCSARHPRQNGVKLCSSCIKSVSEHATYYKRGFSDYNCLAYALGYNGVQSWMWPLSWGSSGPTLSEFKTWIKNRGYNYTADIKRLRYLPAGTNIIHVYAKDGYVQHFARTLTLDGQYVAGANNISKWGACSLYTSNLSDPYTASSPYGSHVLYCYIP